MCVCADLRVPADLCRLADPKMCTPYTSGLCRAPTMLGKQSPKSCTGKPPTHPVLIKNIKKIQLLTRAGKVHKYTLPAFTCCIMPLGKPPLAEIGPILASFGRFMGPKSLENYGDSPPKADKKASKSPKNGFWRPVGLFEGISIHSGSTSKRI